MSGTQIATYKTRKNQLFKWHLTKELNETYTAALTRFFHTLGFQATDKIECQLLHETKDYILQGQFSVTAIQEYQLRGLHFICDTSKYKKIKKYVRTENENGFGVFFSTLGVRKGEAKKVRFHFVDADFGKDIHDFKSEQEAQQFRAKLDKQLYRDVKILQSHTEWRVVAYKAYPFIQKEKERYLERFKNDLKHALIVETANGYHLYFPVKEGEYEPFTDIQRALAEHFEGDMAVVDTARILRMPFTHHVKDAQRPFFVKVVQWGERTEKFTQQGLIQQFNLTLKPTSTPKKRTPSASKMTALAVKQKNQVQVTGKLESTPQLTFAEFVEQAKRIPFTHLFENEVFQLPLGQRFHCLFHADETPSATIYQTESGIYVYKCFSDNCQVTTYTVFDILMSYHSLSFLEAVAYLSNLTGIEIIQSQFQQNVFTYVHQNFQWIKQNLECRNSVLSETPLLHSYLPVSAKHIVKELMMQLLSYPIKEDWAWKERPIFFVSASYLATETRYTRKTVQQNLDLLALLGFIEKLQESDVPSTLYRRAKHQQAVNYYVLHSFDECKAAAESLVASLQQIKFKKKNISYEYLSLSLGQEMAQKVYPNHTTYRATQKQFKFIGDMKEETAVAVSLADKYIAENVRKKGYAKDKLLKALLEQSVNKQYPHLSEKAWKSIHTKVKAYLQTTGYQRVKLTRTLANQYKLKKLTEQGSAVYIWHKQ